MDIQTILDRIYKLPQNSKAVLLSYISEISYPKGYHLFRENRKGTNSYFIKRGIVRSYAYKEDKEVTFRLASEGEGIFPLQTLYANQGQYENVELLEDCILYELKLDKLQDLYLTDIHMANWGRKYVEYACICSEKQFIACQFKTSLERYKELITDSPDALQRVSLGIIASYLGISQVNLSRIRAQMK